MRQRQIGEVVGASLAPVTFQSWAAGTDTISIEGSSLASNTLIGSSQPDTIDGLLNSNDTMEGGGGADELNGGGSLGRLQVDEREAPGHPGGRARLGTPELGARSAHRPSTAGACSPSAGYIRVERLGAHVARSHS